MNYKEAIALAKKAKPEENYLLIRIGYHRFVLQNKDAIKFMEAMASAEMTDQYYGEPNAIQPIEADVIQASTLSASLYQQMKAAQLLNITLADLRQMDEKEKEQA